MILYPAIDLHKGSCVRLQQGKLSPEKVFTADPAEAAERWQSEGAEWLHVVNLDGAFSLAGQENAAALKRILDTVRIPVQFGGGLRSLADIESAFELGISRVVLGTVALREPELVGQVVAKFGVDRVAVGIDARDGMVAVQGWVETTAVSAEQLAQSLKSFGVKRIVYTDIARDGMLKGININATVSLARASGLGVIASGGVSGTKDIRALLRHQSDGIEGVIIGMALYTGALSLPEALQMTQGGQDVG